MKAAKQKYLKFLGPGSDYPDRSAERRASYDDDEPFALTMRQMTRVDRGVEAILATQGK